MLAIKDYPQAVRATRARLVEEGVVNTFYKHHRREILINYGTVYTVSDFTGSSYEKAFDPPIRARIIGTIPEDLARWTDDDHLDPYWRVEVIDHHHHLDDNLALYDVYGLGWSAGKGFAKEPCSEWSFAV